MTGPLSHSPGVAHSLASAPRWRVGESWTDSVRQQSANSPKRFVWNALCSVLIRDWVIWREHTGSWEWSTTSDNSLSSFLAKETKYRPRPARKACFQLPVCLSSWLKLMEAIPGQGRAHDTSPSCVPLHYPREVRAQILPGIESKERPSRSDKSFAAGG